MKKKIPIVRQFAPKLFKVECLGKTIDQCCTPSTDVNNWSVKGRIYN